MSEFERYVLAEPVGSGMFATVYTAHDERFDSLVAIKVLAENHSLNADLRERFITEARALRRIRSPHVLRVHDLGENDRGQPYMVLDHCAGGTLADVVARHRGARTRDEIAHLVDALEDGLVQMHAHRLVHRDLSPANLLLRPVERTEPGAAGSTGLFDGHVVVIADLGFVKDLGIASGLTASGGTNGFAAPEQLQAGSIVDQRADVYAASAIVRWFVGDQHPALDRAIRVGTARRPEDRHPDIVAWAVDVRQALAEVPVGAERDGEPAEVPRRGRRPLLTSALAALLILAVGAGIGAWFSASDDNGTTRRDLGGGQTEFRDQVGDLTLTVTGPATLELGVAETFDAVVEPDGDLLWIAPDGQLVRDQASLQLSANSAGAGSLSVIAIGDEDRVIVEVEFVVE